MQDVELPVASEITPLAKEAKSQSGNHPVDSVVQVVDALTHFSLVAPGLQRRDHFDLEREKEKGR